MNLLMLLTLTMTIILSARNMFDCDESKRIDIGYDEMSLEIFHVDKDENEDASGSYDKYHGSNNNNNSNNNSNDDDSDDAGFDKGDFGDLVDYEVTKVNSDDNG